MRLECHRQVGLALAACAISLVLFQNADVAQARDPARQRGRRGPSDDLCTLTWEAVQLVQSDIGHGPPLLATEANPESSRGSRRRRGRFVAETWVPVSPNGSNANGLVKRQVEVSAERVDAAFAKRLRQVRENLARRGESGGQVSRYLIPRTVVREQSQWQDARVLALREQIQAMRLAPLDKQSIENGENTTDVAATPGTSRRVPVAPVSTKRPS